MAVVVVDAGDTKADSVNRAAFSPNQLLGGDFRARVIPLGLERPVFVDTLARLAERMDEHRAGKDKLLHGERLERAEQATSPSNGDLVVQRARLAGEIVVGRHMDDG